MSCEELEIQDSYLNMLCLLIDKDQLYLGVFRS